MTTDGFVLHLGTGVYLLPDGSIVSKPAPHASVLEAPDGLPFDPKAVKEALTDTKAAIDKIRANKNVQLTLRVWSGAAGGKELLGVLAGIGAVVGAIAPVFGFVGMVLSVATLLGFLREGPSAFESQVLGRLDALDERALALGTGIKLQDIRDQIDAIQQLLDATAPLHRVLTSAVPPTREEIAQAVDDFNDVYTANINAIKHAVNPLTWRTFAFNRSAYKALEQIVGTLVASPENDTWVPARLPQNNENAFDHRMMVPMATWATTTFLTSIRSIKPTHRTSGDHAREIRTFAGHLETLAKEMRATGLARTRHAATHFGQIFPDWMVTRTPFGSEPPVLRPEYCEWVVGAVDMRNFDNQYVYAQASQASGPRQYGLLTWGWQPPALLKRYDPPSGVSMSGVHWTIANATECAAAANQLAVERYAQLLSESGYFQLLQTASTCRSEATEPSASQTLDLAETRMHVTSAEPPAETQVAVTIPVTRAVITSAASRTVRTVAGSVRIRTGSETETVRRHARYKLALRTLDETEARDEEGNPTYWEYQKPSYAPKDGNERELELRLPTGTALDEFYILDEWTMSPPGSPFHREASSVQLRAQTFDWWVPVPDPVEGAKVSPTAKLRELGWVGGLAVGKHLGGAPRVPVGTDLPLDSELPVPPPVATGPLSDIIASVGYAPPGNAQVRDVVRGEVDVAYSLDWNGTDLTLELRTRPTDRNFLIFVVIEEHLLQSGQVLHTALPLQVNSSITEVPKGFFEREQKAWKSVGPAIRETIPVQIPSIDDIHPPGPLEYRSAPDWRLRREVGLELDRAIRDRPEHFQSVLRRHRLDVDSPND